MRNGNDPAFWPACRTPKKKGTGWEVHPPASTMGYRSRHTCRRLLTSRAQGRQGQGVSGAPRIRSRTRPNPYRKAAGAPLGDGTLGVSQYGHYARTGRGGSPSGTLRSGSLSQRGPMLMKQAYVEFWEAIESMRANLLPSEDWETSYSSTSHSVLAMEGRLAFTSVADSVI